MMFELSGKTKKGKQRVKEHGGLWREVRRLDRVLFSDQGGPWLLLVPAGAEDMAASGRWVHALFDVDFQVMPA